jgi:predicted Fe-S protein YdhL (DUF1289 family)
MKHDKNGLVRCRVCGCTEIEPCDPPCSWVEVDLCSGCWDTVAALVRWREGARRPSMAALKVAVTDELIRQKLESLPRRKRAMSR